MRGLVFDCTETGYVPYGPSYNGKLLSVQCLSVSHLQADSAHRVCTVAGAEPGATLVTGEQYVTTVYDDISFSHTSLDIGVIVLFWLGFIVANCLALEKIQWLNGGFILRIFKAGRAPKMNDDETEAEAARKATEAADNMKFTDMVCDSSLYSLNITQFRMQEYSFGTTFATQYPCKIVVTVIRPGSY